MNKKSISRYIALRAYGVNVLRTTQSGGGEVSLISLKLILKINHAQEDNVLIYGKKSNHELIIMEYPLYSSDLALSNYWLFSYIK